MTSNAVRADPSQPTPPADSSPRGPGQPFDVAQGGADHGRTLLAAAILAALVLAAFPETLFAPGDLVLSKPHGDLQNQFVAWREFAFSQLRHGNLPLWNPHIYCGTPFLGGFQSGLLYPLNFGYLFLPLAKAINFGIALHVFLAGFFMCLWAKRRGLSFLACLFCGALWMFCGEHFLHVMAGHLDRLIATAWIPLLFLAIDGLFKERRAGWILLGVLTISMMILGGDPQYVFYTAVAAAIYCALCLVRAEKRTKIALGLVVLCAGGAAIGAVQLWTGIEATGESVRHAGGVPYWFASMFSFPPENFLTLLAPGFFGDVKHFNYWGRYYWWEMCLFIGVTGFLLAIYGAAAGDRARRRFSVTMALLLLILALGADTPLFRALYDWAPGFNRFRGMSKFSVLASAFLVMLAGIGLDRLVRTAKVKRWLAIAPICLAAALGIAAAWTSAAPARGQPGTLWWSAMRAVGDTGIHTREGDIRESYLPPSLYKDAAFAFEAQVRASMSLAVAAIPCAIAGFALLLLRSSRKLALLLAIVGISEMLLFAWSAETHFDLAECHPPFLKSLFESHPGDYRVFHPAMVDSAMSFGACDIWGYSPLLPGRYAEYMAFSQGEDPDTATSYLNFRSIPSVYKMFRLRYLIGTDDSLPIIQEVPDPMPHVALIREYAVLTNRDAIFRAMSAPSFDPARKVILEAEPDPKPAPSSEPEDVRVIESGTDFLKITAALDKPAILLVTDNYARGWRAGSLPGSSQSQYRVMPANYTLRAIPLSAGKHRILLEYMPTGFRVGRWISIASAALYLAAVAWALAKHRKRVERKVQSVK